jgi:hypothetical protein
MTLWIFMAATNYLTATEVVQLVAEDEFAITQVVCNHLKRYKERDHNGPRLGVPHAERALKEAEGENSTFGKIIH